MQIQRLCTNYYVADYEVSRVFRSVITGVKGFIESDFPRYPASCGGSGGGG